MAKASKGKAPRKAATTQRVPGEKAAATEQRAVASSDIVIVGVGASAGGIEACSQLLDNIPADKGLSFVIVQHLDPDHESVLTEILARHSKLPVTTITSDEQRIEANHVYVLPPNRSVIIEEGRLKLAQRKRTNGGPPTPIDQFFASLAMHEGNRAVAVLLSGTGTDGTLGMKQIKAEAGITFAQDDRSASSHGMPASAIAAGVVDFVLPPSGIAKELLRIASHPQLRKLKRPVAEDQLPGTDGELARIFSLLRALNGVDFSYYKTPPSSGAFSGAWS